MHLECLIYIGKKKTCYFDNMVIKVVKMMNGWQGKTLSHGGRMVLIKSVFQSLPTYTLTTLNPPKNTMLLIEKHIIRFFWGSTFEQSKYHWSSWKNLYFSKEEGGVGIRSLQDISNTLAIKRWWHFRTKYSLWANFLKAKYCSKKHTVQEKWSKGNSQGWKNLIWVRDKAEDHVR